MIVRTIISPANFPDLVVMHWCSQNRDVVQIYGANLSQLESLDSEIEVLENSLEAKQVRDEIDLKV